MNPGRGRAVYSPEREHAEAGLHHPASTSTAIKCKLISSWMTWCADCYIAPICSPSRPRSRPTPTPGPRVPRSPTAWSPCTIFRSSTPGGGTSWPMPRNVSGRAGCLRRCRRSLGRALTSGGGQCRCPGDAILRALFEIKLHPSENRRNALDETVVEIRRR